MSLTKDLIERAMKIDPAMIGHYIQGGFMNQKIKPVDEKYKIIGPAFTVSIPGKYSAILYYAMRRAPEGSIIVVDRMGDDRYACCGEGVARVAKNLKLGGIVIDGPSTDTLGIKKLNFPVFSTGRSPVTTTVKEAEGNYNKPISCGGVSVSTGDIIFGDADGVIVIDKDEFEDTLVNAEKMLDNEKKLFSKIDTEDMRKEPLFPEKKVKELLAKKGLL